VESLAAFVLLLDAPTLAGMQATYDALTARLAEQVAPILGFRPLVRWVALPQSGQRMGRLTGAHDNEMVERCLADLEQWGARRVFLLPASFDFDVQERQWLVELTRTWQRRYPELPLHYDSMQLCHPLLLQALVDSACQTLAKMSLRAPNELGVLLIANGAGGPETRADSYRMMRLIWEQLSCNRAEVAFVRHTVVPLPEQLASCARMGLSWLGLPQFLWPQEQLEYARVIFNDSLGGLGLSGWSLAEPLGEHPNVTAWLVQRMLELYRRHRKRFESRIRSPKYAAGQVGRVYTQHRNLPIGDWDAGDAAGRIAGAVVAEVYAPHELARLLSGVGLGERRCVVKPTWHGYATGTYSDALALDALLASLAGPQLLVEGHTASRNTGGADFDWESEALQHRGWILEQEQQYLAKTGLRETLKKHRASYLNVTECWWDAQCAPRQAVLEQLEQKGVRLHFEELADYVPQALFDLRGSPLLSFARFKGPTRLCISNLFGLLPQPLRAAWHGPNITYFARVCCDLAKLYGVLFELYGLVESLSFAVRWEPRGLYRSRWGNYDLIECPRVVCLSRGLPAADVLAARLQGQDVNKSAFFDVVGSQLGFDAQLGTVELPGDLLARFA
jgi:sirohydrochlorin ferrochelatase